MNSYAFPLLSPFQGECRMLEVNTALNNITTQERNKFELHADMIQEAENYGRHYMQLSCHDLNNHPQKCADG